MSHRAPLLILCAALLAAGGCPRRAPQPAPQVLEAACRRVQQPCTPASWMKCGQDAFQCHRLGLWLERGFQGRVAKDPARARRIFAQLCDRSYVVSCGALCRRFGRARRCVDRDLLALSGQGTPMVIPGRPVPRSRLLTAYVPRLKQACGRGDRVACIALGFAYDPRRSIVSQRLGRCYDDKQRCFSRACRVGSPLACAVLCHVGQTDPCVELARLVLADRGMASQKFREADGLLTALCVKKKSPRACYVLGLALIRGLPLLPQRARGLKLLERACQGGLQTACATLRNLPPTRR